MPTTPSGWLSLIVPVALVRAKRWPTRLNRARSVVQGAQTSGAESWSGVVVVHVDSLGRIAAEQHAALKKRPRLPNTVGLPAPKPQKERRCGAESEG